MTNDSPTPPDAATKNLADSKKTIPVLDGLPQPAKKSETPQKSAMVAWLEGHSKEAKLYAVCGTIGVASVAFFVTSVSINIEYLSGLAKDKGQASQWIWTGAAVAMSLMAAGLSIALELIRKKDPSLVGWILGAWAVMVVMIFSSSLGASTDLRGDAAAKSAANIKLRESIQQRMSTTQQQLGGGTPATQNGKATGKRETR